MNIIEEWKFIPGYENLYQCSNLGRIKSLQRKNEIILKPAIDRLGYCQVVLYKNNITKNFKLHQLVAITFLKHIQNGHKIVIDHLDGNKLNNNIKNLRLVTQRENMSFDNVKNFNEYSSKYIGVCWFKRDKKWKAQITYKVKNYHLGLFDTEIEASNKYQEALLNIKNNTFIEWMKK